MTPGGKQFLGLGVDHRADTLAADLNDAVGGARCLDDLRAIRVDVDHRLLEVNVLAGLHRIGRRGLVPVIGCRDQHGVDILARQNLAVVASGEHVLPPQLFAVGQAAVVAVSSGNQLDPRHLNRDAGIVLTLDACSDESQLDVVVRRARRRGLRQQRFQLGGGCGQRRGLYELSAIQHRQRCLTFPLVWHYGAGALT